MSGPSIPVPILRLALLVLLALGLGCATGTGCRREAGGAPRVVLRSSSGQPVPVRVEVVRSEADQRRGLMFREHLAPDAGMLFVYPAEMPRTFWMKNTYIPLDMVFIGANLKIVGIVENAEPLTTTRRQVDAPSRFVLEVNGGFLRRHGVRVGSPVRFQNIPGAEP